MFVELKDIRSFSEVRTKTRDRVSLGGKEDQN